MRNLNRWIGWVACGLILAGATCACAQDWSQWRGANRDGKATFTAPGEWPKELTQTWKASVGLGCSTPALVGDKLYVFSRQGEDEVTRCLSAADGKILWKVQRASKAIGGPAARAFAGPRSSPAVADGKVVTLGVNGDLFCLNAADGKELWSNQEFKGVPKFYTGSSPLIVDGTVLAQLGSEGDGALVALDLAAGTMKWKWAGEGSMYSSPAVMTAGGVKQVVTLTSQGVVGVALADGKLLWKIPFAPKGMAYNAATPIVDGNTVIFSGSGRGTKAVKIEKEGDGFAAKDLWTNADVAVQFNTPVLKDGWLFGFTDKGSLFCLSAKDGTTAWTKEVLSGRNAGFAGIVDAGSCLLALPNNSQLIAYKSEGKEFSEIAKLKAADTATYATPVVSGKRLFVKDQDSLTLWTLP